MKRKTGIYIESEDAAALFADVASRQFIGRETAKRRAPNRRHCQGEDGLYAGPPDAIAARLITLAQDAPSEAYRHRLNAELLEYYADKGYVTGEAVERARETAWQLRKRRALLIGRLR